MNDLKGTITTIWLALIAVLMWILQLVLSILRFRRFAAHVKEMRCEGRVAIGKAKERFVAGAIVLLCGALVWMPHDERYVPARQSG